MTLTPGELSARDHFADFATRELHDRSHREEPERSDQHAKHGAIGRLGEYRELAQGGAPRRLGRFARCRRRLVVQRIGKGPQMRGRADAETQRRARPEIDHRDEHRRSDADADLEGAQQ